MSNNNLSMQWTYFNHFQATAGELRCNTWSEVCDMISNVAQYSDKKKQPLLKLGIYENNSREKDSPILKISGIELDYDAGEMPLEEAAQLFKTAGIEALFYSTFTATAEVHKWRALIPLSQVKDAAQRAAWVEAVNAVLGNIIGKESYVPKQGFFYGRSSNDYQVVHCQGEYLDNIPAMQQAADNYDANQQTEPEKPKPYKPKPAPDQRNQVSELQDALKFINADDDGDWVKIGMALFNLGDTGFQLWDDWSKAAGNYEIKENLKRWKSFGNSSVNVETVFYVATKRGWENPRKNKYSGSRSQQSKADQTKQADDAPHAGTALVDEALQQAEQGDVSALQDEDVLEVLRQIRAMNELAYQRYRSRIQALKKKPFPLSFLDKQTKPPKPPRYVEQSEDGTEGSTPRQSKADLFIEMVKQWGQVFSDESSVVYVSFVVESIDTESGEVLPAHVETYPLNSDKFQSKAGREFYQRFGTVCGDSAMKEGLSVLAAEADEHDTQEVYFRYGMDGNIIYVDLMNDDWQMIEINAKGWKIIESSDCPVKFRRVRHARPLPVPEPGGNISALWDHINISREDSRLLVLAWLLESMRISTHYPPLEIIAGQGSGKSLTQERLKVLLDPNHSNLRKEPDSMRDLSISAGSNHVISLNNMSHLPAKWQDFFCNMSTGGGDSSRKLYSNADEEVWDIKKSVVMNGINQLITRPDLADRTVCVELPRITTYTDEETLKAAWLKDYPKLTGALYSLLSGVLRELPNVELSKPPRMADFAKLGTAMVRAMGQDVDFVAVFNRNRDAVVQRGVEASPVALALLSRMNVHPEFIGTMGELMQRLDDFTPKHYDKAAWPKSPRGLGEILRRLAPALEVCGIMIEQMPRRSGGCNYRISKIEPRTDTLETEL